MTYAVAVDIGGTFTDLVAYDAETRRVAYAKSPTTYGNLVDGVLDSYANPAHEEQTAEVLRKLMPGVYITHSTEVTREWYEYERTSTVAANGYVGPQVTTYIRRLEHDLAAKGFTGSLYMMGSNGGLMSVERTCEQPVALVESGPIGGCIGAGAYAEALGFKNVIAFDMGGTTAKCALVENGRFSVESIYYAGGYVKGFPIKSSVIHNV